jgi:hypothetical protein
MDPVHECGVVAHLGRQCPEQMADALLVLYIDLEIPDQYDRTVGADALATARELAALHVPLHDVDAVALIERDAGNLVEADHVVLTDQAALAVRHVNEHPCHGGFAAGNEMCVRGYLLEEMAFAGPARPQLHHVVVPLDERDHAQQGHIAGARGQRGRLEAHASK